MTGLEKIKSKIISEAERDAAAIIERTTKQCADIMFAAGKRAESIKAELEERAQKDAENIIARAKSSASMQKRNVILSAKGNAIDEAFDLAYKEIKNLPKEKYCELISKLIASALLEEVETEKTNRELYGEEAEIPEKYELIFNREDRDSLGEAILAGTERIVIGKLDRETTSKLTVSRECADIEGGVIVRFGNIENNCSIEALFDQIREKLGGEVAQTIFSSEEEK